MVNAARILSLLAFLAGGAAFLYVAHMQAPQEELAVLRSLVENWNSILEENSADPLARSVLISNPSSCLQDERPDWVGEAVFDAFIQANHSDAAPIRLSALSDLIAVASFEDAKRADGLFRWMDVGDRSLVAISRVGIAQDQALVCVEGVRNAVLYLFERNDAHWEAIEDRWAWVT